MGSAVTYSSGLIEIEGSKPLIVKYAAKMDHDPILLRGDCRIKRTADIRERRHVFLQGGYRSEWSEPRSIAVTSQIWMYAKQSRPESK